ncbi:MAG: hypothetical protein ACXWEG_08415 [Actinomycetota bacterium]
MQASSPVRRGPNATNIVSMLLGLALVLGAVLTVLALKPAGSGAAFAVTAVEANACPAGEGAPACFQVLIQNTGSEAAHVRCRLTPAEGTTAVFFSGDAVYTSAAPIAPKQTLPLSVKVNVTAGNDTVVSPSIGCSPLSV